MDQHLLAETITKIDDLMERLANAEESNRAAIDKVHPDHRDGALNLVHYTALRSRDIRPLQARLSEVGATRLTTTEPSVVPRLKVARNVLSAYAGQEPKYGSEEVTGAFNLADDILEANANRLLGEHLDGTHSRIMVTLPTEAGDDPDLVRGFAEAGMELARINCAHDSPDVWARMIEHVHAAAEAVGREIKVAMDLAGPKLRTGEIAPGPAVERARVTRTKVGEIITPAKLWLTPAGAPAPEPPAQPGRPTLSVQVDPAWLADLSVGSELRLVDVRDSKRVFFVRDVQDVDGVRCAYAEGEQNAYLANTTLIEHDWQRTRVAGIEASEQKLRLTTGDRLTLTTDQAPVDPSQAERHIIGCTLPEAVEAIQVGEKVLFDDGAIAAVATAKDTVGEHTEVTLEITRAGLGGTNLAAHKGINLPDTELPLPSLTDEDLAAFRFVARHGDIVNVSFIRNAEDVADVLDALAEIADEIEAESGSAAGDRARGLGVVLKIETIPAYEQLGSVLLEGMRHPNLGIMVARGDLAVELGFERMAEVPRFIMNLAESAHVPTVMATQVLESLAKSGLPTRAEITDAAYALRAESVMLNKGPHINDTIAILNRMSAKLGNSQRKNRIQLRKIDSWENTL